MFIQGERIESRVIEKASKEYNIDPNLVEKVNSFQWKVALEGLKKYKDVEISELCTLKIKPKLVDKQIISKNKTLSILQGEVANGTALVPETINRKIKSTLDTIEYLKSKL